MELKTIRCYSHLTLEDRWLIEQFDQAKMPVSEIARRLGKHRSTVYREMKRNRFQDEVWHDLDGYFCVVAHSIAQDRRERTAKLSRLPKLRQFVVDRLSGGWSPEQIAGRLRLESVEPRISHESIYRFVYTRAGKDLKLHDLLPERRKHRRPRLGRRTYQPQFPKEISIHNRPDEISGRREFGHWEAVLMMFQKVFGKANVTTLTERLMRFTQLLRNPDHQSQPIMIRAGSGNLDRLYKWISLLKLA